MYILLDEAKKHLEIDKDFHDDDKYITHLISVAEDAVAHRIDKCLEWLVDCEGNLKPTVKQEILLLVGNLYNNRESDTNLTLKPVPTGFEYLCNLDKHYFIP